MIEAQLIGAATSALSDYSYPASVIGHQGGLGNLTHSLRD